MSLPSFKYHAPNSVEAALKLLAEYGDEAMIIAGGLTVMILLRERLARPRVLISLSEIPELGAITINGNASIGATVTHTQVTRSVELANFVPLMAEACGRVGSPGIRNMGTVGGSISQGDGASDTAPALLALGAEAVIAGPDGQRKVPLKDFFFGVFATALEEGEILIALEIPTPNPGVHTRYMKYTCTSVEAYAAVTVATAIDLGVDGVCSNARIGLGSVAPMPIRAVAAESLLKGHTLTPELIAEVADVAASETDPSTDGQGTADYRRDMTRVWVRRLLEDTVAS